MAPKMGYAVPLLAIFAGCVAMIGTLTPFGPVSTHFYKTETIEWCVCNEVSDS